MISRAAMVGDADEILVALTCGSADRGLRTAGMTGTRPVACWREEQVVSLMASAASHRWESRLVAGTETQRREGCMECALRPGPIEQTWCAKSLSAQKAQLIEDFLRKAAYAYKG